MSTSPEMPRSNRPRELKSDQVLKNTMKINTRGTEEQFKSQDTINSNNQLKDKYNIEHLKSGEYKHMLNSSFNNSKNEFSLPNLKKSYAQPESTKNTNTKDKT